MEFSKRLKVFFFRNISLVAPVGAKWDGSLGLSYRCRAGIAALEFPKTNTLTLLLLLLIFSASSALGQDKPLVDSSSVKLPFEVPKNPMSLPATAEIRTTKGSLIVKFFRKEAPISVANFAYLAKKNIYNGTFFHRYTPGFAIQGGDPTGTTKGGPGWNLPPEIRSGLKHQIGTFGWAMLPAEVNPERLSNGSQFYITLRAAPDLDHYYTVFAQVVRGLENLKKLRRGDKILSVILDPVISTSGSSSSASRKLDWPINESSSEQGPVKEILKNE